MEREKDQAVIDLGNRAKRLTENEDFKVVIEKLKVDLFSQFTKTNIADSEDRENLHKLTYAISYLEKRIEKFISLAKYELRDDEADEQESD